jgi:hypothetical protein
LIDFVFHFHRKGAESAKKRYLSIAVERTAIEKKSIATRYFWVLNDRRACFLLFSVLSTENNKINNLWVLCGSNERSKWAVKLNWTAVIYYGYSRFYFRSIRIKDKG